METHINGTYGDYGRSSGRSGEVRERMLPRHGAVDYQFARRGEMSLSLSKLIRTSSIGGLVDIALISHRVDFLNDSI